MRPEPDRYWFPARRYAWGWGLPTAWQGWAVIAVFVALAVGGLFVFPPQRDLVALLLYLAALNVALMAVCWFKGEPPRWRWGGE
jgi:hypothetical protein